MVRYQTAFASTEAREDTADLLRRVHDAYMEGRPAPAAPREVIRRSWDRVRRAGVDPDAPAGEDDATERRAAHDGADSRDAATMRAVVTMLRPQLDPLLAEVAAQRGELRALVDAITAVVTRPQARPIIDVRASSDVLVTAQQRARGARSGD